MDLAVFHSMVHVDNYGKPIAPRRSFDVYLYWSKLPLDDFIVKIKTSDLLCSQFSPMLKKAVCKTNITFRK